MNPKARGKLKREMEPVSESRVLWESGQQVRRSDKVEHTWKSEKSREAVAVRRNGKLRLTDAGRDFYLKKQMRRIASPIIDALVPKIKPSVSAKTQEHLVNLVVERVRGATTAEEKTMKEGQQQSMKEDTLDFQKSTVT